MKTYTKNLISFAKTYFGKLTSLCNSIFWSTKSCLLLQGDSASVLKKIPSDSIDGICTSPPYFCPSNMIRANKNYKGSYNFKAVARELVRIIKPGKLIIWNEGDATVKAGPMKGSRAFSPERHILFFMEKLGLKLHEEIIWSKGSGRYPDKYRNHQSHEKIYILYKGELDKSQINILIDRPNKTAGQKIHGGGRQADGSFKNVKRTTVVKELGARFSIWKYTTGGYQSYKEKYLREHPAVMHYRLVNALLRTYISPTQADGSPSVVLDPFNGVATTANEALKLGLHAIGIEMASEYCALSKRRLSDTVKALKNPVEEAEVKPKRKYKKKKKKSPPTPKTTKTSETKEVATVTKNDEGKIEVEYTSAPKTRRKRMTSIELATCAKEKIDSLVEGILPTEGVVIIAGQSGSRKTWLAMDLALEISRGGKWFGQHQTTQKKVLYYNLEVANQVFGQRYVNLCKGKNMAVDNLNFEVISGDTINLKEPSDVAALEQDIKDFKPGLVVLDPMVCASKYDENHSSQVSLIMELLKDLSARYQTTFLLVDHHSKLAGLRGSTAKTGYAETVLSVTVRKDGISRVVVTKNRNWEVKIEDKHFSFTVETDPNNSSSRVVLVSNTEFSSPRQDPAIPLVSFIARFKGVVRKQIVDEGMKLGLAVKQVDALLKELVSSGAVLKRKAKRKGRGNLPDIYTLPRTKRALRSQSDLHQSGSGVKS